ncbi:hypothetical protein SCQ32_06755 [Streptococcus canis]|uniref:Lipoprotein n=1 Tax=Streptococcus canis FSL Z3-227 TaxID=482234 RepID=A0AAV3FUG1_STRCB|nr:hypothetical protein [Streptococcus canis]EIQ82737.1 hypothetical protein SCAZ3_10260 [Streptococcus canis FSL Z3-227]MDV5993860.1 hypothetical protein [Streptococcus canis]MDW7799043.1 hypothetical protein [Streptococcus canis]GFK30403.1 hypothetical protein ScFU149_05200 [Streptococcus canis]
MAKVRKFIGLFTILLASILLVACGQKTTKDGVPTILQDKYSGYSNVDGYYGPFVKGGSELAFDKKKNTIVNLSDENGKYIYYYQVVPEDKLSSEDKGILAKHKKELEGKDYFIIKVDSNKEVVKKPGGIHYGVVLTDGGKAIRIFEFEWEGYSSDLYYNFNGEATK